MFNLRLFKIVLSDKNKCRKARDYYDGVLLSKSLRLAISEQAIGSASSSCGYGKAVLIFEKNLKTKTRRIKNRRDFYYELIFYFK